MDPRGGRGQGHPGIGARVLNTAIRRNIKLAECPSFGKTIFDYASVSHGADDYLAKPVVDPDIVREKVERLLKKYAGPTLVAVQ